jgi:hypothetical protein
MLFWKSLVKVHVPIALIVPRQSLIDDEQSSFVGGSNSNMLHDVENQAARSRQNSLNAIEMITMPVNHTLPRGRAGTVTRGRSTSIARGRSQSVTRGRSGSVTEKMARALNITEIEAFNYEDASKQGSGQAISLIKDVVCLISGSMGDRCLLAMTARIAERNGVHILVIITSDVDGFPEVRTTAHIIKVMLTLGYHIAGFTSVVIFP